MGGIEVRPIGGHIGAEVCGVDPRDADPETHTAVHAALLEHEVIFFRAAHLTDDEHMEVARRFGQPSVFPLLRLLGTTEPALQVIRDDEKSPPSADNWHTDVTWTPEPPKLAFLRATLVPERGGDTIWGSMTAAYDALSGPMRALFDGLRVVHDNESFIRAALGKMGDVGKELDLEAKLRSGYPPVEHPLVRVHPETGSRALLFGGDFMRRVVGMRERESQAILGFLVEHIAQPAFQCRWHWTEGDFAIWDERSTVHRAIGDHYPREREVRRCVVDGSRPVGVVPVPG